MKISNIIILTMLFFNNINLNAQCTESISSIKVYKESFTTGAVYNEPPISSGEMSFDILNDLKLTALDTDGLGYLCIDGITVLDALDPPIKFSQDIDITMGIGSSQKRHAMTMYHLTAARNFANQEFPISLGTFNVKVEDEGEAGFMVDGQGNNVTIDFRKPGPGNDPYYAFSEDAGAIASGYYQALHKSLLVLIPGENTNELPQAQGVRYGISDYLAFRYLSHHSFNTGTNMYVHAGVGTDDWATIDINFGNIDYAYNDFYFLTIA
ncbi:MAG: hypothetical protein ACJATI_001171, partial [Halioglobus sp.]